MNQHHSRHMQYRFFGKQGLVCWLVVVLLTACVTQTPVSDSPAETISLTDETGATVTLAAPATRIVCLESQCNGALAALGQVPVATVLGQAVDLFGDQADAITILGGSFFEPNVEDIVTANPDLIVGFSGVHDALRPVLEDVAPLYLITDGGYEKALDNLRTVGTLMGHTADAEVAVQSFTDMLATYKSQVPTDQKTTVVIAGTSENFTVLTAKGHAGSILSEVSNYPWVDASDPDARSTTMSFEALLEVDPDVIFVVTFIYGDPSVQSIVLDLERNSLWSELTAVQNGNIYEMRDVIWNATGPYSVRLVLDEAFPLIYPDVDIGAIWQVKRPTG